LKVEERQTSGFGKTLQVFKTCKVYLGSGELLNAITTAQECPGSSPGVNCATNVTLFSCSPAQTNYLKILKKRNSCNSLKIRVIN
jgi:hypothetical protein